MIPPMILRPEFVADLVEAKDWYEFREPGLGNRLEATMDVLIDSIQTNPWQFALGFRGVRKGMRRPFPYLVIYRILKAKIDVIALVHGRRHPSAWTSRI
jgi:toxin ParE1/3/4